MKTNCRVWLVVAVCGIALIKTMVNPQASMYAKSDRNVAVNVDPGNDLFSGLRWRNIGPFHGGRVSAVSGAIGQPGTFYLGAPLGGMWKTTSAGVSWFPIFDQFTNVDSIGAIQVAPSDANIVYAGTGDSVQGSSGDGMYKSIDAGKTWMHIGLEETTRSTRRSSIPKTRILSSLRRKVMRAITAGASIERPTVARPGRTRCDRKTRTARATSSTRSTCRT